MLRFARAARNVKLALAVCIAGCLAAPACFAKTEWHNVAIGGGGCWVTGIVASVPHGKAKAAKRALYIRTDCGGAYRRDKNGWTAITDWLPFEHRGDFGIESIATDPQDGSKVYIACGGNFPDDGRDAGTIYRSSDGGVHWAQAVFQDAPKKRFDGTTGLSMDGNGTRRWGGERMACDPALAGHLLFGSRKEGLWRSTDDAKTWSRVAGVPNGAGEFGVTAVAYDPRSNGMVYATVEGVGLTRSTDHGATWKPVSAASAPPASVRRLSVSADGTVWMTCGDGGCIAAYHSASNTYTLSDPGSASYFIALAVNPANPKEVVAAASTDAHSEYGANTFWHSTDEGATWQQFKVALNSTLPWYQTSGYTASALMFDPQGDFGAPGSLWYTDGVGVWRTRGTVSDKETAFYSEERGHEEMCVTSLCTPPSGPNELLTGVMDQDGFASSAQGIAEYPHQRLGANTTGPWSGITLAIADEETAPQNIARLYSQRDFGGPYHLAVSTDAGATWQAAGNGGDQNWVDSLPQQVTVHGQTADFVPQTLAINSTDPNNIVVLGNCRIDGTTSLVSVYTTQGIKTKTWAVSDGLFQSGTESFCSVGESNDLLVADPVNVGVFYSVNGGYVYKSTDGGKTFARQGSPASDKIWGSQKLQATPGKSGDLWYSAEADKGSWQSHMSQLPAWEGLYHSTDGGSTWSKIPGVTRCVTFSVGAKSPGGDWTLYYYGRNSNTGTAADADTVYRSTDSGAHWACILDPSGPLKIGCYPLQMQASRQTYGRVFIGTAGRGVFYSTEATR